MFGDKPKDVPQPFALILVPEFTMMPVTSAIEPLRLANRMSEKALYRWTMHSVDGQPVAASNNILTMVNGDLETVPPQLNGRCHRHHGEFRHQNQGKGLRHVFGFVAKHGFSPRPASLRQFRHFVHQRHVATQNRLAAG